MTNQLKKLESILKTLNNINANYKVSIDRHMYSVEDYMPITITLADSSIWIYPDCVEYCKYIDGDHYLQEIEMFS